MTARLTLEEVAKLRHGLGYGELEEIRRGFGLPPRLYSCRMCALEVEKLHVARPGIWSPGETGFCPACMAAVNEAWEEAEPVVPKPKLRPACPDCGGPKLTESARRCRVCAKRARAKEAHEGERDRSTKTLNDASVALLAAADKGRYPELLSINVSPGEADYRRERGLCSYCDRQASYFGALCWKHVAPLLVSLKSHPSRCSVCGVPHARGAPCRSLTSSPGARGAMSARELEKQPATSRLFHAKMERGGDSD